MRVLITGSTGFIGSHLARRLAQRPGVRVFTPTRAETGDAGENLKAIVAEAKPHVVVHLASLFLQNHAPEQVEPLIRSNILFGTNLLEAMSLAGVRCFVNAGTPWEHWNGSEDYRPACLYAATKRAFEDILKYYADAKRMKAVTLKLFDTYGPKDARPKLFSLLKKSLSADQPLPFSPGEQTLDLLYIEDAVEAFDQAIDYVQRKESIEVETIHIGSGKARRLRDVAQIFSECAGKPVRIAWGARPYREREVMRAAADLRMARKLLGWEPKVELKDGIRKLLAEEPA